MPAIVPIDNSWGAVLISVFIGTFLYGIVTLQMYIYYQRYPKDRSYLKALVGVMWSLDTLHTIFITHMAYFYLVTSFGDYNSLQWNIWSFNVHVFITTIVACIVQVFFVHRCWALDKGKFNICLSGVILCLAGIQLVFGIICTVLTFRLQEFIQFQRYNWAVVTWLGSGAACDILVSAAIVRSLWMSRTGIPSTNSLIIRLIVWTVNTGIITSVTAILDITLFSASQDTLIHIFFNLLLAKLYPNTLLATLNHRRPQNDEESEPYHAKNVSLLQFSRPRPFSGQVTDTKLSGVHITTQTMRDEPQSPA